MSTPFKDDLLASLFLGSLMPSSSFRENTPDSDVAKRITYSEPESIAEAIVFYEKRLKALKGAQALGVDTLEEYNKIKDAEKTLQRHKEKMNAQKKSENTTQEATNENSEDVMHTENFYTPN